MQKFTLFFLMSMAMAISATAQLESPDVYLPHKLGEQFTEHAMLLDYFRHVAANSDRVQLQEFGRTNEQRTQLLAIVSSPDNLKRLEEIRLDNMRRAGFEPGTPAKSEPVAIVWLGFSVHGNEAAGSEASMKVIYELANPDNAQSKEWLKNTVVLIEPSVNPDGYSRYTSWYRQASPDQPDPNPIAREHVEPWPGGRVNHYLFDLNRDWAWATQVESKNRLAVYNQWLPHVVADLHEQFYTSPYYFAPAAQPYHDYLTQWQSDFQVEIGKNHAKYFDRNGWLYFTREVFDLFYPSYGDSYPCFNGAIGMTYEQGGHSRAGRAIEIPNGDTLTLYDRVLHHTTTALSTIEISSLHAGKIVDQFSDYFEKSRTSPPGKYKSFIIKGTNPVSKIRELTRLLDRHHIAYGKAPGVKNAIEAYEYRSGQTVKTQLSENDLVISVYQPKGLLTQVLFEPEHELVDSLTYDITAWCLMHAHGLDGYASTQRIDPAGAYTFQAEPHREAGDQNIYAYLLPWNSLQSARVLAHLLKHDLVVRYAEEPFSIDNQDFDSGTLIISRGDNRKNEAFDKWISSAANEFQVHFIPVQTGLASKGKDLGSKAMRLIEAPKVLVLAGDQTYNNEYGQVWFYFDQEIDYPATYIDAGRLAATDLHDYNVLIMPEGSYRFDDNLMEKLSDWTQSGGRIIAIGAANRSLAGKKGFALAKFATEQAEEAAKQEEEAIALDHRTSRFKDRVRHTLADDTPGAVVRVKMDTSHPLAFGLSDYYFSLKTNGNRFDLLKNAWNTGYLEENYLSFGFIGCNLKKKLEQAASFAVQDKGAGRVIYLIDNPLFRSFWQEGKLLFSNALFLTQ